ncbi:MAG TPA: DNA starvation/stationary phase protection protein Dps [Verrucomicrobiae bacterium]|nr:DNA starvation/stationary phase protection protein Dps [Verrucomicrobiae bacterium]
MKSTAYKTKNDLSEKTRGAMIELLNQELANVIDLSLQTKQAHWNVKGPHFIALHELFDDINEDVASYVDEVAERAVQLGGIAKGTIGAVATATKLPSYPLTISDGIAHVEALSEVLAVFGRGVRKAIDTASQAGDADTADLFTEISRGIDKWLWFVEAHLQAKR